MKSQSKPASGSVTLTPDETKTTVRHPAIEPASKVFLMPCTGHAAAAWPGLYVGLVGTGYFEIMHAAAGTKDRRFNWFAPGA